MKTNSSDGKKTTRGSLKKRAAKTALWLLVIILFAWMLLPVFAEAMLPVLLKKYAGISSSAIDIRTISPMGTDAADFSLGPSGKPFLEADSIRVDFTPLSLLSGSFDKLSIGGGILRCSLKGGKFTIPGLVQNETKGHSEEKPSETQTATAAGKTKSFKCPGKAEISNFIIEIDADGSVVRVPVDISVEPTGNECAFKLNAKPFEKGEGIDVKGHFDPSDKTIVLEQLKIDLAGSETSPLLSMLKGIKLEGILSLSGKISLSSREYELNAIWKKASLSKAGASVKPLQEKGVIRMNLSGSGKSFKAELQDASIRSGDFRAGLKLLKLIADEKNGILNLSVPETPLTLFASGLGTPKELMLSAGGTYNLKDGKREFQAKLLTDEISSDMKKGQLSLKSPCLNIKSETDKTVISFKSGELSLPAGVTVSSLDAEYQIPGTGVFKTDMISYSGKKFGCVEVELESKNNQLRYKGQGTDLALPGIEFTFKGKTFLSGETPGETAVDYALKIKDLSVINPGDYHEKGKGFELKGTLDSKGTAAYTPGQGLLLPLSVNINDLSVENKEKKLLAEGVKLVFFVPDLMDMNGAGRQRLTFEKIAAGNFKLGKGIILFRMEPQHACFIEKFEAKCSEGSIAFHALKIIPSLPDYRTVLFCNRLNFAEVLTQLGIVKEAEGKGTVSGRIPLVYYNGDLSVEDGFLYSSPGDGGKIRLSSPEVLSSELLGEDLANSAQAGNIELARQAIAAFDYKWAKMNIKSEGENLLIAISMFGKPVKPLLFKPDEEHGGYVKVKSEEEGSIFSDMMIEFNFRLPVNKTILYGTGIWRLLDEFKKLKPGAFK